MMPNEFICLVLGMFLGAMIWDILKTSIKKVVKKW